MTHIVDSKAKDYIRMLPSYTKRNLTDLFPGTSALALNLLEGMLHFNPKKRLSAYQALNHPFFDSIRPNQHDMVTNVQISVLPLGILHETNAPNFIRFRRK